MAGDPPTAPREANALLMRMIGVVLAIVIGIGAMGVMPMTSGHPAGERAGRSAGDDLAEARRRALEWSTPECKDRMRKAVARAGTERDVEDAAWAACPNHPDAYD